MEQPDDEQRPPDPVPELTPEDVQARETHRKRVAHDLYVLVEIDRRPRWFTQRLFELMLNSDGTNMAKLATVYPIEAQVLLDWRALGPEWLADVAGVPKEVRKP